MEAYEAVPNLLNGIRAQAQGLEFCALTQTLYKVDPVLIEQEPLQVRALFQTFDPRDSLLYQND
eukprot:6474604-Amphidinium_carterae.2